jgi:pilus assembly protein CpaB
LTAGVIVAVLAGLVAFATLSRATAVRGGEPSAVPSVTIVVATKAIPVRSQLTADDVATKEMAVDAVPEGAVAEIDAAVGKVTTVDLYPGEVILAQRLVDPNVTSADGRVAVLLAEDQILVALPANDLMSQSQVLKPGDQVDLLFSLDFPVNRALAAAAGGEAAGQNREKEQATFDLLQNVTIAAIVAGETDTEGDQNRTRAVLLTLSPQDALTLKYVIDAGGTMDVALRAPGADETFETLPVDVDYVIDQYKIPTQVGR